MDQKNITRIPHYLSADTEPLLMKAMLENNLAKDKPFEYFGIQKVNSKWIAWYYDTISLDTNRAQVEKPNKRGKRGKR